MTACVSLCICRQDPDQAASLPSRLAALDTWLINAAAVAGSADQLGGPQSGSSTRCHPIPPLGTA